MKVFSHIYNEITSLDNLFQAWEEFKKGKRHKIDVGNFERHVEDNIFELHKELVNKTYKHYSYTDFYIKDPKVRHIHKAEVKDRVVHHALFKVLNPIFEPTFISDSFSCRKGYGTHKGFKRLVTYARKVSRNYTRTCWALKCDIKKFFDSVDHKILLTIIRRKIKDPDLMWLVEKIVGSYSNPSGVSINTPQGCKGIPIGNLTSQIFANIYLNELDQFVKHEMKVKHYLRYADDFILLHEDYGYLSEALEKLKLLIEDSLKLQLHKDKISFRKLSWGIDFIGYLALPHHQTLRTKTKKRIYRKIREKVENYNSGGGWFLVFTSTINQFLLRNSKTRGYLQSRARSEK